MATDLAGKSLGFPMVVKSRYGAGGGSVFKVGNKRELLQLFELSKMNYFNFAGLKYMLHQFSRRLFLYHLIKEKKMIFPLLSPPLLAQKFIVHDRDIKTVIGNYKVIEGHWRQKADAGMWKVNIDGGGIGIWSAIPQEILTLSERLARDLKASWLNIDILPDKNTYLISEFSPVWHHYRYKEKTSFVYADDYNLDTPLEVSLDLEKIIVESLINRYKERKDAEKK
jgi:glutathione synthase/RimK-type ligase-like ATP-grasp enzyme